MIDSFTIIIAFFLMLSALEKQNNQAFLAWFLVTILSLRSILTSLLKKNKKYESRNN